MRKLLDKLQKANYANNLIFVVLAITFFLLTLSNISYLSILIIYSIYIFKKKRSLLKLIIILITIILIIYLLYRYDDNYRSTIIEGKIIDCTYTDTYNKYIIRTGIHKVLLYDYDNANLKVGMIVNIKGEAKDIDTYFTPNAFDYIKYLKNNHIFYALVIKDYEVKEATICLNSIRYFLINYFDNNYQEASSALLKALLVGYSKSLDSDFYTSLKENGTMHLFAISGLHVSFFTTLLANSLAKIKLKEKSINIIIVIFLCTYIIITNFSASILRTSIMYFIAIINKKHKLNISSLDICSISFIILVLVNPLLAFNNGFILSYLVSFTIIIISPLIRNYKNVWQILLISISSLLITLPVIININYQINLLSPFINVLFILITSFILLPFSIIVAFCYPLDYLYHPLVEGFMEISKLTSNYFKLNIRLPKLEPVMIITYYLLIGVLFFLKNKKSKIKIGALIILYLIILSNISLFKPYGDIYFLDLYYGEATVIFSPFKNSVVLIDTGDGTNSSLTTFLKSKGVKKIECIIITHNHLDHMGELDTITKEFKVDEIVVNYVDDYDYGVNVNKVGRGDTIKLNKFSFEVLNPKSDNIDINDNSIVLKGNVNDINLLMMGDATSKIEDEIINHKYDIDIIKIGHHGSVTSTSKAFLEKVKPKIAIIMAGRVKKFHFPHEKTLTTLDAQGIKTFSTNTSKTIWVRSFMGQYQLYSLA